MRKLTNFSPYLRQTFISWGSTRINRRLDDREASLFGLLDAVAKGVDGQNMKMGQAHIQALMGQTNDGHPYIHDTNTLEMFGRAANEQMLPDYMGDYATQASSGPMTSGAYYLKGMSGLVFLQNPVMIRELWFTFAEDNLDGEATEECSLISPAGIMDAGHYWPGCVGSTAANDSDATWMAAEAALEVAATVFFNAFDGRVLDTDFTNGGGAADIPDVLDGMLSALFATDVAGGGDANLPWDSTNSRIKRALGYEIAEAVPGTLQQRWEQVKANLCAAGAMAIREIISTATGTAAHAQAALATDAIEYAMDTWATLVAAAAATVDAGYHAAAMYLSTLSLAKAAGLITDANYYTWSNTVMASLEAHATALTDYATFGEDEPLWSTSMVKGFTFGYNYLQDTLETVASTDRAKPSMFLEKSKYASIAVLILQKIEIDMVTDVEAITSAGATAKLAAVSREPFQFLTGVCAAAALMSPEDMYVNGTPTTVGTHGYTMGLNLSWLLLSKTVMQRMFQVPMKPLEFLSM